MSVDSKSVSRFLSYEESTPGDSMVGLNLIVMEFVVFLDFNHGFSICFGLESWVFFVLIYYL